MEANALTPITVSTEVAAPINKVWASFTEPQHIIHWCNASDDWHAPHAENDLRTGGKFLTTMAAKDGSFKFNFEGTYTQVEDHKTIGYVMEDGRKVKIDFTPAGDGVQVVETFDPENTHPPEVQRGGWQAILDNYKKYTEALP